MKPLGDVAPLLAGGSEALEAILADYEAEGLPEGPYVAACLRRMPERWAAAMLSIRAHAKADSRRWRGDHSDSFRTEHEPSLHVEQIEGVRPAYHVVNKQETTPFVCHNCDGTRWLRMVNRKPDPVDVETDNAHVVHSYGPDESYLVPCPQCSPKRCLQYRTRKPLGDREPIDRRKPREVPEED